MPIRAFYHNDLALGVHRYSGAVGVDEVRALAAFYRANRAFVRTDLISLVEEDATDPSELLHSLADLRREFRALQTTSDFVIVRRSIWVCENPTVWAVLEAWLHERHSRDGQGTEVALVPTLALAEVLFSADEIEAVAHWKGFQNLFSSSDAMQLSGQGGPSR